MVDRLFYTSILGCALCVMAALCWVLADVFVQGMSYFSWSFLFLSPADAGRAGGIAPILVSTLYVLFIALAAALPLGLGIAIWLSEFAPSNNSFTRTVSITLDVLAGVPSIIYGLFGNAFFCIYLGMGYSLLSGGLTLACMILPIFVRSCESGLRAIDNEWRRGAIALGMTRSAAIWHILLPAARPAIIAGLILGTGRATAETAALMFTSGYVDRMPESIFDSGRVLSVHIFDLSMNITGGDNPAYASALVLVTLIIALNLIAQYLVDGWFKKRLTAI